MILVPLPRTKRIRPLEQGSRRGSPLQQRRIQEKCSVIDGWWNGQEPDLRESLEVRAWEYWQSARRRMIHQAYAT